MNNVRQLPQEIFARIIARTDDAYIRSSLLCASKELFSQVKDTLPNKGTPEFEALIQRHCEENRSPRRAFAFYKKSGSEPMILDGYKWAVSKDVPLKKIMYTCLATTAVNVAFLSMNGQLMSAMAPLMSTLSTVPPLLFSYIVGIAALSYFDICKNESAQLGLGIVPAAVYYYLNEVPKVIVQLFKGAAYTSFYFLILHAVTAAILIKYNVLKDASTVFRTLGLLIVSVCLFKNMANSF